MSSLLLDLRYALRMMIRAPGFTAVLLVTLALGIGATTTIFSILESMVLRPLPYDRPEQLVRIYTDLTGKTVYRDVWLAASEYFDVARDCRSCAAVAGWTTGSVSLAGGDHLPAAFAGLGLALALVGIYGVIAHAVAQRTPEIGLRVALGARPAQVRAMVLRQAATLVASGLAIGLGIAVAIQPALGAGVRELFYGEPLAQPALCTAVALCVIATAFIANWIQPTVALRTE